jgi:hypothetical protein
MTVGKAILLRGLSTDTKPTRYADGTIFIESDTGTIFTYNATKTSWLRCTQTLPTVRRYATWSAHAPTTGFDGFWNGQPNPTIVTVGTGTTNLQRDASGLRIRFDTGATINSLEGLRINSVFMTQRDLDPEFRMRIKGVVVSNCRIFIGLTGASVAPVPSSDYLATLSGIGFWANTAVDTNWKIMQNNGAASSDITTISNVGPLDTNTHEIALRAINASSKWQYQWDNGVWNDVNTAIPAATTGLGWLWYIENVTAANNQIAFLGAWAAQNG